MTQQLTIQQITDRLAEEAGWKQTTVNVDGMTISIHPFPPDSIDAAVRALPNPKMWRAYWMAGRCWVEAGSGSVETVKADATNAPEAFYRAAAKARGWM